MELKDFIGATVFSPGLNRRFAIQKITAPEIHVVTLKKNERGCYENYSYRTINGDPFSTGSLVFENPALTEPFKAAFDAYCRTEDAYWENYGYWMYRD